MDRKIIFSVIFLLIFSLFLLLISIIHIRSVWDNIDERENSMIWIYISSIFIFISIFLLFIEYLIKPEYCKLESNKLVTYYRP